MIKELYGKAKETIDPANNLDSMSYRDLVGALENFLQRRRYLIVIDDVWNTEFWQDISIALPANMNGSRILLTSEMKTLLLLNLELKLVAKCEGLPLAIVALDGLMASKNSIAEWNEVYNNFIYERDPNQRASCRHCEAEKSSASNCLSFECKQNGI
ncbi:hypothetical protein V6N11_083431 [Hibiscus sabdariffa]|uniref:NB-ARC domain-containing protein n=1 Tax=Hibiscus sabdariffa TaxID=183260 RepID=A0ABR2QLU3_9ROSI